LDVLIIHPFLSLFKDIEASTLMAPVPPLPVRSGALLPYFNSQDRRNHKMKDNDFVPAKIIGGPDATKKERSDPKIPADTTGREPVPIPSTAGTESSTRKDTQEDSYEGILDRFTGKDKSTVVWASPWEMFKNDVFNGLYKSTVDRAASDINGIVITAIFHAYLLIGYYLLAVYFNSDERLAFSKNSYKETSLNDLAKRDDIPFTRQKLTGCIKAAAVDMELNKGGHHLPHVNYDHLDQLARLKKQEERLELARKANEEKLTSNELKQLIDARLGKTPSQDKQIARAVTRQLREFVRLASDEDVQAFLEDKERSAALDHTEIAQLLDFSGKFRETAADTQEMLKQLEANLRENFVEKQEQKVLEAGKDSLES
jgi:hypothetical protein